MSKSFRPHFLLRGDNEDSYIKLNYEYKPYCNSRFNSTTKNMLVRLQNTVAQAINKNNKLAKYIIIVLDDDLIMFLDYKGPAVTQLLGDWITWFFNQVMDLIAKRKNMLPKKSKRPMEPCVYFTVAPTHCNFDFERNKVRKKLNNCVETICKNKQQVHLIRLKQWDYKDGALVQGDKITRYGMDSYWDALESAFQYNALKHELFVARQLVSKSQGKNTHGVHMGSEKGLCTEERHKHGSEDDVPQFFRRHRDDFHWKNPSRQTTAPNNRFLLPRLDRC